MDTNPNEPQYQRPAPGQYPGGPAGAAPQQGGTAPKTKSSKGKIIGLTAAGLVAVLVILLVGSELFVRNRVENCLADNVKNGTQANDVKVSISKTPMLLQLVSGKISSIDIQAEGLNQTPGLSAHVLLEGVDPSGDNRVDNATIVGTMTAQGIKDRIAQVQILSDTEVTLDSSSETINIKGTALIFPVTVSLKPAIKNNQVELTASKASVSGFGVPDDLAQQLITAVNGELPTPKGLTARDLKMTDDAITLSYTGQNVLPNDIESSDRGAVNCSLV